jgi:Cft2 family RNA processing exonuclease
MFTYCPLQGALSESLVSQSLLELDGGVKILVDIGWDESFDVEKLKELEKSVILFTGHMASQPVSLSGNLMTLDTMLISPLAISDMSLR